MAARRPSDPSRDLTDSRLPARLRDAVLRPDDPTYATARLMKNTAADRMPAMIVMARDVDDVALTIELASTSRLPLAVRATGHSVAGHSTADGAIVLDLSGLAGVHIDPVNRTAWADGGVRAGAFTVAAHAAGFAVPFGDTGSVGIAGLTLGGGMGLLVRKHGLTIDSLLSVELITATGERVTANATAHPDLFWALRGGGGNFGVATRFTFAVHPLDTVLAGEVMLPATREVLRRMIDLFAGAPDALTVMSMLMPAPPSTLTSQEPPDNLGLLLFVIHSGPAEDDEAILTLVRSLGPTYDEHIERRPYPSLFPPPSGIREADAARTLFMDNLDDDAIDVLERWMAARTSPEAIVQFRILGGAVPRTANDATAFGHRDRRAIAWIITSYQDLAERPRHEAWAAGLHGELLRAGAGSGAYVNFMGEGGDEALRSAYPPQTLARLVEVKRRYDPANLFRSNLNIPPVPERPYV